MILENYLSGTPLRDGFPGLTMEEARAVQDEFVLELKKILGEEAGYKAALTNPEARKRFGATEPLRGVLLRGMLVKSGAWLPVDFGARPMCEGDLLVRVRDDGINNAKDLKEVLVSLESVIPFIELPDMVYSDDINPTAPMIVAINAGARYGVLGEPIPITPGPGWEERLRDMTVEIRDSNGALLADGRGSALMGHPLNVVLWIRDSLRSEGKTLKKGDILSLGGITRMLPIRPGMKIKARYTGLLPEGAVEVSVGFAD
ncbi:MAG: hydratase [Deltaproteobacteria bacterium]|nr:hydratase [Deltaproteobacteria bacterium]